MTPGEKNIVKSLIAVAWADGRMEAEETSVVEGLLVGFDASTDEEWELVEYAKTPRRLDQDLPLEDLSEEERELLFANAALLTWSDGKVSQAETKVLEELVRLLGFSDQKARAILTEVRAGAELRASERPPR